MRIPVRLTSLLAFALAAPGAGAHPHMFIDTGLTFHLDDRGQLAAVGVVWVYDALSSLLTIEDQGLDPDGDGILTPAETEVLNRLGRTWPEDFDGNLHLMQNGQALPLSGPLEVEVTYHDGRLVFAHMRALTPRVSLAAGPVDLQVYDPTYYTFYDLSGTPQVAGGAGCSVAVGKADIAAAQAEYDAAIMGMTDEELLDEELLPDLGGAFADEIRLTCAPSL